MSTTAISLALSRIRSVDAINARTSTDADLKRKRGRS